MSWNSTWNDFYLLFNHRKILTLLRVCHVVDMLHSFWLSQAQSSNFWLYGSFQLWTPVTEACAPNAMKFDMEGLLSIANVHGPLYSTYFIHLLKEQGCPKGPHFLLISNVTRKIGQQYLAWHSTWSVILTASTWLIILTETTWLILSTNSTWSIVLTNSI